MMQLSSEPPNTNSGRNDSIGLKAFLDDVAAVVKRLPAAWVRCELHALKVGERFVRMEFIEVDREGKQIAKVQGGCWPDVWKRIESDFAAAGLALEAGSTVMVKLQANLNPVFGFQIVVSDIDLKFALGDLNARIQAIKKHLQDAQIWNLNRSLAQPADFVRVSVIAPSGAAGLGDFRSTADRLAAAGLAEFVYHEVPFQTRDAPAKMVDALRQIYRECSTSETRHCAVAIIRGGGASADLAWLIDQKLAEAVCRMNVPVMTGIGHERDRNLLDEIACIACDTPSKVAEHIKATITRAALNGQRAEEAIRAHSAQLIERSDAAIASARSAIDRDGSECVRLSEAAVRTVATELQPGVRALLDNAQAAVHFTRTTIDRNARETVRLAELTIRTAATGLEPNARDLLEDTHRSVGSALEDARAAARQLRELSAKAVQILRGSITLAAETAVRPFEIGTGRALTEIRTRLDALPRTTLDEIARVHREIAEHADRTTHLAPEKIAALRKQVVDDVKRRLDDYISAITIVRERADAVHPRTVLAAGYAILRNPAGEPLTGVDAVKKAGVITAELRDGATGLLNDETRDRGGDQK